MDHTFDPDLIHAIFKLKWNKKALERQKNENTENLVGELGILFDRPQFEAVDDAMMVVTLLKSAMLVIVTDAANIDLSPVQIDVVAGTSKKNRPTSANANALKLSSELLRVFVTEAVQRAATIAEAEGVSKIQATHLERILPQLLLDF